MAIKQSVLTTNTCAHSGCSQDHSAENKPRLRPETPATPGRYWLTTSGKRRAYVAGPEAEAGGGELPCRGGT